MDRRGARRKIPAITDFRAKGTIMGPTGLTAVFGMGTGVAPPVWSPERRRGGGQADATLRFDSIQSRCFWSRRGGVWRPALGGKAIKLRLCRVGDDLQRRFPNVRGPLRTSFDGQETVTAFIFIDFGKRIPLTDRGVVRQGAGDGSGWSSDRLLGLVRCGGRPPCTSSPSTWWSSRSLHSESLKETSSWRGLRA